METKEELQDMIIAAMKAKQQVELGCFRALKTAIEVVEKSGNSVGKMEIINILRKQIAQRKDSATAFISANRVDLADKENQEIEILQRLLPIEWSDEELELAVELAIKLTNASSKKDMGRVIKEVVAVANGRCDNKRISTIVSKRLNQ